MKYVVDFEREIDTMLNKNIGVCPYFSKNIYGFFERFGNVEHFRSYFCSTSGISCLRRLLNDETLFENPLFGLLFKAFVYAEVRFISKYIPQNSHEERLTGHLLSEYISSLNIINNAFKQKAFELYNSELDLDFHYADLSTNRNESSTGADFGLIFHINLPDYQECVRVAIVQSKKLNKSRARIDSKQCETLIGFAKGYGYYCFYDMTEKYSPLVQIASIHMSQQRKDIIDSSIPLSVFLTFDILNVEIGNVKLFTQLGQAKKVITDLDTASVINDIIKISRVLIVSIGGIANSSQEIKDLLNLF